MVVLENLKIVHVLKMLDQYHEDECHCEKIGWIRPLQIVSPRAEWIILQKNLKKCINNC